MKSKNWDKGFSLLETLLYLAIFAIIGGSLFGILTNVVRISTREVSGDEVASQLQFAMETVTRLVQSSSNIEIATTTATTTLKLRMTDPLLDPTCISLINGSLKLSQGPDAFQPQNCSAATTDITTNKIIVDSAFFKRVEFPGGHDQVAVDLQFSNTATGASKISRALRSGISRASAATFDSDLLPNADNSYEVGFSGTKRWKNISISNVLNLGVISSDPGGIDGSIYYNSTSKSFRGKANGIWGDMGSSLWVATSTHMYSNVTGNVGIGTSNPLENLSISGGTSFVNIGQSSNAAFAGISFGQSSAAVTLTNYSILGNGTNTYINRPTGGSIYFRENNGDQMIIKAGGNVGIGTAAPVVQLHLVGGGDMFRLENTDGVTANRIAQMEFKAGTQNNYIWTNNQNSAGYYGGSGSLNIYTGQVSPIVFFTNGGNERMRIDGSGNIGIGTTNPTQKLDVVGNIAATGGSQGTYIELAKGLGSLPGYPSNTYPTLKTDFSYIYFSAGGAYSAHMSTGGVWTAVSDKNKKENFIPLNSQEVLKKIGQLPIMEWNFKEENAGVRHIGPFAQDFYKAFKLNGTDDTMMSNIDPTGVALVGIQGLLERSREQQKQINELKEEIAKFKK